MTDSFIIMPTTMAKHHKIVTVTTIWEERGISSDHDNKFFIHRSLAFIDSPSADQTFKFDLSCSFLHFLRKHASYLDPHIHYLG